MRADLIDEEQGPRTYLGESPRWDGHAWWWVDAAAGEVWTRRPGGSAVAVWRPGRRTSLVHPEASGRVVVACEQKLFVLDWEDGGGLAECHAWCDLDLGDRWLVNDGVADAAGRLWIGSVAPGRERLGGALLRIDADGSVSRAAEGFTLTNGMAWDAEGSILFHVDTYERTVWAHHVNVGTGDVLERERFLDLTSVDGLPDGIATDVDGGVWVAMYGQGEVRRYDRSGRLDLSVQVEPPQCTSVELGGPDGRDVLITTAREGYNDVQSASEPLAGRLFHARSLSHGVPKPKVVASVKGLT